jgi:sterol-4alpha-carboxylate 3-dehydrogenase (decarboxylating)
LIKRALSGGAKIQFGYGENLVDTCYVENCAYAHILAAKALVKASGYPALPAIQKVEGEVFFVTDDKPIPFWTFSRLAARTMGVPVKNEEIQMIPRWFTMIVAFLLEWAYWIFTAGTKAPVLRMYAVRITTMERTVCIDKIKERLGYVPQVTTEDGMKRAVEWYFKVDREGTHIEKSKEV